MPRRLLASMACAAVAVTLGACGEQGIQLAEDDPNYAGAVLFQQRCAGCHSLEVAGAQGGAKDANGREYKDGPNFNVRKEQREQVLYAIRNGGYSSGPMPQNIVVGQEAQRVADFLAKYSGRKAARTVTPGTPQPEGTE